MVSEEPGVDEVFSLAEPIQMSSGAATNIETARLSARRLVRFIVRVAALLFCFWTVGAIAFLVPETPLLCTIGAWIYLIAAVRWLARHRKLRDWSRWALASFVVAWVAGMSKQPSNDRLWAEDHAVLSEVEVAADDVVIRNLRSSRYSAVDSYEISRSDFRFDIRHLRRMWFVVHRFTPLEGIAHNFLTFEVNDGTQTRFFSVSVEVRREVNERFSPLRGLYRGFELVYVFADELDEVGQRLQFTPEDDVYLFPVNAAEADVQTLFLDIADRANRLRQSPEFYHSLLNNCTNNIVLHTRSLTDQLTWLDPRIVAPGFADRYAFSLKLIGQPDENFADLKRRCRLKPVPATTSDSDGFSTAIRQQIEVNGGDPAD